MQRQFGIAAIFLGLGLDLAGAHLDDRELGGDEKPVEQQEKNDA